MRTLLLAALLFAAACKDDKKPSSSEGATPTERSGDHSAAVSSAKHPALPHDGDDVGSGARPRLPGVDDQRPDWNDPAIRAEWEEKREERRKRMEAELDTNKDGKVSPEEHAQRVKPMLERMDQNNDGKLTPDEMAESERRMGFDDPAALDTDKSGDISLMELDTAVTARREKMRTKWRGRTGPGMGSDE
ncbi:MAG TPA: hypothetical protein VMZ53_13790 [Kofleriaceae bacterium]|nr:hypothetical protein [Kofleriaceae bacterium]